MAPDRVDLTEDGKLDEIVSTKGAHLEYQGGANWFLEFYHEDGTSTALWFNSRSLQKPFMEKRGARKERGE